MKAATLTLFGVRGDLAEKFAAPITDTMEFYDITTKPRQGMFLANILHESGCCRYVRELWGPTPSQTRYEGRKDLGNTEEGDGKRFMGRGLIQVTGRSNYRLASEALGVDLLTNPELLETPALAVKSAGWFWDRNNLNDYADQDRFERVVRIINGGTNGMDDRLRLYDIAKKVL